MLPQAADARARPRIGRYVITGRIGRGGMGMVYRGLDEALEREVAVKTLNAEGSLDADSRRRFEVEAKAAARLQHPNIVTVYELGEDRGLPFIAMELLAGRRPRGAAALGRGAAARREARRRRPGLPRARLRPRARDRPPRHQAEQRPPARRRHREDHGLRDRQARGHPPDEDGHDGGHRALHEPGAGARASRSTGAATSSRSGSSSTSCSPGERPFRGEGATQVLYKIVQRGAARRSTSRRSASSAPRLQAILARALAKDPDARYPAADALADDLAAVLEEAQKARGARRRPGRRRARRGPRGAAARGPRRRRPSPGCASSWPRTRASSRPAAPCARRSGEQKQRARAGRAAPRRLPGARGHLPGRAHAARARDAGLAADRARADRDEPGASTPGAAAAGRRAGGLALGRRRRPRRSRPSPRSCCSAAARPAAPGRGARCACARSRSGAAVLVDGRDTGVVTNGELVVPRAAPRARWC